MVSEPSPVICASASLFDVIVLVLGMPIASSDDWQAVRYQS